MQYKFKISPKRKYERAPDGDIVPGPDDLSLSEDDYFQLTLDEVRFPQVLKDFNDQYQASLTVKAVDKGEKRRAKLADHWYKRADKSVLRKLIIEKMPKAIDIADELGLNETNDHFRSYYFEAKCRINVGNLVIPTFLPDKKLAHFPHFDGQNIHGTPLQIFRMYMSFFPPRDRKIRAIDL